MSLPIDRLPERNNYRASLVTFESDLRAFTLTLDTLKDSIDRGQRTLEHRLEHQNEADEQTAHDRDRKSVV